jgi:hypothetical protein
MTKYALFECSYTDAKNDFRKLLSDVLEIVFKKEELYFDDQLPIPEAASNLTQNYPLIFL